MWENKKGPALLAMFPVNRIRKAARQRRVPAVRPAKPAEKLEAWAWANKKRSPLLDDRFHETGLDEASIHGTGIMFVDSLFGKS